MLWLITWMQLNFLPTLVWQRFWFTLVYCWQFVLVQADKMQLVISKSLTVDVAFQVQHRRTSCTRKKTWHWDGQTFFKSKSCTTKINWTTASQRTTNICSLFCWTKNFEMTRFATAFRSTFFCRFVSMRRKPQPHNKKYCNSKAGHWSNRQQTCLPTGRSLISFSSGW